MKQDRAGSHTPRLHSVRSGRGPGLPQAFRGLAMTGSEAMGRHIIARLRSRRGSLAASKAPDGWTALPLLYRAALRGVYGEYRRFERGGIADALFVFLDGAPDPQAVAALDARCWARPWVCLTDAWEAHIKARYPDARIFRRYAMKPARRFRFPEARALPASCRLADMDEAAFARHPFSHGVNYPSFDAFRKDGSGAVVWRDGGIVASASSFLSLDGEVELDVSTLEAHRGKGLAAACVARMLRDCQARGIAVHWDAQNETSRHLAGKFGFELEREYPVYWQE